jgi:hypothetical protein
MSSFFTLLFILPSALHKILSTDKQVLQTPCYCIDLLTLTFHRRYQHRHLTGMSAVRLVESELCARVTMIMSYFSSCHLAKTSTNSLLEDQQGWTFFVLQDISVPYWSLPLTFSERTLTYSPLINTQDVFYIYRIIPVFYNVLVFDLMMPSLECWTDILLVC